MKDQVRAGGLWCGEVLDRLLDYQAGTLPLAERGAVEAHLAGCHRCAEFGGAYGAIAEAVRAQLQRPEPLPQEVAARLSDRLRRETGGR